MSNKLLNTSWIKMMTGLNFAHSHGAAGNYLGGGIFYYGLVYTFRFQMCYCLGSSAGFVPMCMRQAQRDVGIESRTLLIDADLGGDDYGWPIYHNGPSTLTTNYPEIKIIKDTSKRVAELYAKEERGRFIDYMHIDANHSYESASEDFTLWRQFIKSGGFISLHDSYYLSDTFGVATLVDDLKKMVKKSKDIELINFNFGDGTCLVRLY